MTTRRMRADNAEGIASKIAQSFVTWGDRQTVAISTAAPGTLFFPFPVAAFRIPNLKNFNQLVDMRYERPTTWALNLFIEAQQPMNIGDQIRMLWDVNVSVGHATNKLQFETNFTKIAVPIAPAAQSAFLFVQVAAQTIQVIPEALSVHFALAGNQTVSWSAWIAPIVD